jgi:hypothetical protein
MRQNLPRGQPQSSTLYIGDFSKASLKRLYEILDRELGIRLDEDALVNAANRIVQYVAASEMAQMKRFSQAQASRATRPP